MITTKTEDLIRKRSLEMAGISDALYEAGMKEESREISMVSVSLMAVAAKMSDRFESYNRAALSD